MKRRNTLLLGLGTAAALLTAPILSSGCVTTKSANGAHEGKCGSECCGKKRCKEGKCCGKKEGSCCSNKDKGEGSCGENSCNGKK